MNGVFWSILGTTTFICPSISLWYCGSRCLPSCHWNPYQDSIFCCVCRRSPIKTTSVPIFTSWLPIFFQLSPHVCPSPRMNPRYGRPWAAVVLDMARTQCCPPHRRPPGWSSKGDPAGCTPRWSSYLHLANPWRNRETVALWTQEESLTLEVHGFPIPIGSMYGIYTNIGGILMVNVTIYGIHGSYGIWYGDHFRRDKMDLILRNQWR